MAAQLVRASLRDTLAIFNDVLLPTLAKGVIIRRPRVVALSAALDLDARAVRRLEKVRATYGEGPVRLRIPGRSQVIVLAAEHAERVLRETPEPFRADSSEKRAALNHF